MVGGPAKIHEALLIPQTEELNECAELVPPAIASNYMRIEVSPAPIEVGPSNEMLNTHYENRYVKEKLMGLSRTWT